jgi:hypothetical protein
VYNRKIHFYLLFFLPYSKFCFFLIAKALLVRAKADAGAEIMKSDGHKEAEILRAEGAKEAAKLIESSQVAITLETIKASAMAIKDSDKFFFGQQPEYMSKMLHSNGINMT